MEHETIQLNKTIEDPEAFATALVFGNPLIDEIRERGGVSSLYNSERPHTALDKRTPDIAYFGHAEIRKAA